MATKEPDAPQDGNENALSRCSSASGFRSNVGASDAVDTIHEIYRKDYDECISYARSRLGSAEAAQDVVQQAFTNTLNAVENGAHISNIGGFVRRCVHNLCVNRGYREHREPTLSLEERLHEMTGKSTAASAELREQWREVESIVDQLAPNQRDAFLLTEIRGYTYRETAESMNLSISSVRQLLNRARNKIRARADTGPDSVFIPTPVLGADSAFKSWQDPLRSKISDWTQPRVSELQAWLGNVSQAGTDALLQSSCSLIIGLTIIALGTASPAPSVQQDAVQAAPTSGIVVNQRPLASRPYSHSTGTRIDETMDATPRPSDVVENNPGPDPLVKRVPDAVKSSSDDRETDFVGSLGTDQSAGSDQEEGSADDPEGGSDEIPEDPHPQDPCPTPVGRCFIISDGNDTIPVSVGTATSGTNSHQESQESQPTTTYSEPVKGPYINVSDSGDRPNFQATDGESVNTGGRLSPAE